MKRLWRSGSGSGVSAPPDAADSPASPVRGSAGGELLGGPAVRRRRRRRRILIAAPFLVVLLWAIASYTVWMLQPTSLSWGVRSVEWVRQEVPFGNWLVDEVERIYYTLTAPKKGGPPLKSLPTVGLSQPPTSGTPAPAHAAAWPPPIEPVFAHPLPGEGVWKPTGPPVDGGPPVLVTTFRPELNYPQLVAYVAWFDHTRTATAYYPGRYEPPNVAWARQSLAPIVWNGQLNPQLNDNPDSPQWGYTLGGATRVWRSGVGIDRQGNLIYVAADGQTVITLAKILQHLGAVQAMEFDINPEWHTLITYTHGANGLVPTMVGPNPMQAPTRYLVRDDRDFFAVYRPLPGPVTVP